MLLISNFPKALIYPILSIGGEKSQPCIRTARESGLEQTVFCIFATLCSSMNRFELLINDTLEKKMQPTKEQSVINI